MATSLPVVSNRVLPVLSNNDLNRAKNKKASDELIPFLYESVIAWGCQKEKGETFLAYYNRRPEKLCDDNRGEWEKEVEKQLAKRDMTKWPETNKTREKERRMKQLKEEKLKKLLIKENWKKVEKDLLDRENCEGLDATFLHKLIPTICDGIGRFDPNTPSSTEIEKFLREVKNKRNEICHDPRGASISGTILDDLEASAVNVFNAAGDLYASTLEKQAVQDKIDELKKMMRRIKEEVMTDEEQKILQIAKKMSEDGKAEMHEAVKLQDTDFLPLSDDKVNRSDVFHSVDLLIKNDHEDVTKLQGTDVNKNDKTNREIPCDKLFEHFEGDNLLCEGQPGTGKTTLLKTLREDFGAQIEERFRGIRKFDLLMYMECNNSSITTVNQLLEQHFPKTIQQFTKEEVVKALLELKLLICVEGLDELMSHTKMLLRELISKFGHGGNATFIFTSRPGQARSISLRYQTVTLQPITEEEKQVEFLRRYQASIKACKGSELVTAFQTLSQTCKAVLIQPVYLALFCAIFKKSPQAIDKFKNELSLLNNFQRVTKQTMIERMDSTHLENPECYANDVTDAIIELSVCLLQQQKVTIDDKTYTAMCRSIFGNANVPYYAILSCYFTKHPDQQTYTFFHKVNLEFLAAKAITRRFIDKQTEGVFGTIDAIVRERRGWIHDFQDGAVSLATAASRGVSTPALTAISRIKKKFHGKRDGAAQSPNVTDGKDERLKQFENVFRIMSMILYEDGPAGALKRFLKEVCPALTRAKVEFPYWAELVYSCPDSKEVIHASAQVAKIVSGEKWVVYHSRNMIGASKMLRYRQPTSLVICVHRLEEVVDALTTLLKAVVLWHTGELKLLMFGSYKNFTPCDDILACLEYARCKLDFRGCLSGGNVRALRALVKNVERTKRIDRPQIPYISLMEPRRHKLGPLKSKINYLDITVRQPSSPGDRCHRPLPTCILRLKVEWRPAAGDGVMLMALVKCSWVLYILYCRYYSLHLLHYPGSDVALNRMVARLRASGVRTDLSSTCGWQEASIADDWFCTVCCDSSSHRPGERCVDIRLKKEDVEEEEEEKYWDTYSVTGSFSAVDRVTAYLPPDQHLW